MVDVCKYGVPLYRNFELFYCCDHEDEVQLGAPLTPNAPEPLNATRTP